MEEAEAFIHQERKRRRAIRRSYDSYDLVIAPLCEAGLLLLAGAAAMLMHKPLFFASLGPTAYELAETPERKSAQPYSVIVGHLIGVVSGFVAIYATHAWRAPAINTDFITWARVWAAMLAALLTVAGTTLFRATQPAALSTTLMIATGSMQRLQDGPVIMAAILLLTIAGEPLRRWRHSRRALHVGSAIQGAGSVCAQSSSLGKAGPFDRADVIPLCAGRPSSDHDSRTSSGPMRPDHSAAGVPKHR